jgi:hypothetical protein
MSDGRPDEVSQVSGYAFGMGLLEEGLSTGEEEGPMRGVKRGCRVRLGEPCLEVVGETVVDGQWVNVAYSGRSRNELVGVGSGVA